MKASHADLYYQFFAKINQRERCLCYTQFSNNIYIYNSVIQCKLYKATKLISSINISIKDQIYLNHAYLSNELLFTQNLDKIKH